MEFYHFTVYLDDDHKQMLKEIGEELHVPMSDVFRTLIRVYHRKVKDHRQTIGTGRAIWIAASGEVESPNFKKAKPHDGEVKPS